MVRLIVIALPILAGCGIKEEAFIDRYAELFCAHVDECGKLNEQFGTIETCEKDRRILADEDLTATGCTYNPKAAKECLKDLKNNEDCDIADWQPESCDRVSNCSGSDTGT